MSMLSTNLLTVGTLAAKALLSTAGSVMQSLIVVIPSHHTPCRRLVPGFFVFDTNERTVDLEMYGWPMDITEADTKFEERGFICNRLLVGDYCIKIKVKNTLVFWVTKPCGLVAGKAPFLSGFFRLHRTIYTEKEEPYNSEAERALHNCASWQWNFTSPFWCPEFEQSF